MTILTCTKSVNEHGLAESCTIQPSKINASAATVAYYLEPFRGVRWDIGGRLAVPLAALREVYRSVTEDDVHAAEWGVWLRHQAGVTMTPVTAFTPDALSRSLVLPFNCYVLDRLTGLVTLFEYSQEPCVTPSDGCFLVSVADLS